MAAEEAIGLAALGGLGEVLGRGGQGTVFRAPGLTLPDAPGPLVYKQYKARQRPSAALRKVVAVRNGLDPMSRSKLDLRTAWPLRVVEDGRGICGVVMALIPEPFFQTRVLPGTGTTENAPREIQNLIIPPARAQRVGMPQLSLAQRLGICRDFAAALHLVHKNELVVGDLNARNGLFRLDATPGVMLVDCDAIRIRGSMAAVAQLNAPDWESPDKVLSQNSDRYKYGLFVLRSLATGGQIPTTRDPARADAVLDRTGRQLLRQALGTKPTARPTAQTWGQYFQALLTGAPLPQTSVLRKPTGRRRNPTTGKWEEV